MSGDKAVVWLSVTILIGFGILVGQIAAVMVASMVGVVLLYRSSVASSSKAE